MIAHLKYLKYVAMHKWFVLVAGIKTGAPLWRLIIHDWSKFSPAEWSPYVNKFYGIKYIRGSEPWQRVRDDFDKAWLHHQHHNPHHWQHWLLRKDDGDLKALRMPESLMREMVADWMGAGRAITGKWEVAEWYAENAHKMVLHDATRARVDALIEAVGS